MLLHPFRDLRVALMLPAALGLVVIAGCDDDDDPTGTSRFGTVQVTTTATGYAPDIPETIEVGLVGGGPVEVDETGQAILYGAPVGSVDVEVANLPAHCTANSPQTVEVTGPDEPAAVSFAITCTAITGSSTVTLTQTGVDPDAAVSVIVDAGTDAEIVSEEFDATQPFTVLRLTPGDHEITLAGLGANCTPLQAVDTVTVTAGEDVALGFTADCVANIGDVTVNVTTIGDNPDPDGYTVAFDENTPTPIGVNGTVTFDDVPAGPHEVTIAGLADNCTVGTATQPVEVVFGDEAVVDFTVNCPAAPPGG